MTCPYCKKEIKPEQNRCKYANVYYHIQCAFEYLHLKMKPVNNNDDEQDGA